MNEEEKPKKTFRSEIALLASIITVFAFFTGITTIFPPKPSYTPEPARSSDYNTPSSTLEITPTPTTEVTPTVPYEDTAQASHQSSNSEASITQTALSNAYQELLNKCLLFDSSLELPFEAEMLDQTVIRYVEGSFPKSNSGGMYLCKSPGKEQIALLKPHTPVTVHAVRGSLSESTGYAFVETGTGQFGWVAFQSTRGTGIGLAETNDF